MFEGCDRSGKTTQVTRLVERLNSAGRPAVMRRFPDRTTSIGTIINSYLGCKKELEDHVVHLLFSANRWELRKEILETLESGTSVCIDRYAYSGVAFSAAKVLLNSLCLLSHLNFISAWPEHRLVQAAGCWSAPA